MLGIAETFQSVSGATRGAAESARQKLDRAGYRAQQVSLAISLGLLVRGIHYILQRGQPERGPTMAELDALRRRYIALIEKDLENVDRGYYPRDLLFQIPFGEYARLLPSAIADLPRVIARRWRNAPDDLPEGIDRSRYPHYYLRNFHWQTDGWLSERSASLYDFSVEVLFQGTGDVMRRMAIPPVVDAVREVMARRGGTDGTDGSPRILDIACGTGRFLQQLHRALPEARLYGIDLSPFYVAKAKKVLAGVPDVTLLIDNAEAVPLKDGLFDVVTSVFLFHELPKDARRNVMREAYRLLKPGGRFVICDAAQLPDSPELDVFFHGFETLYHEPYFKGYLRDDLTRALTEVGFESTVSAPWFFSKVAVAQKPADKGRELLG